MAGVALWGKDAPGGQVLRVEIRMNAYNVDLISAAVVEHNNVPQRFLPHGSFPK